MKRRPTIEDLAKQAGVSVATVDRVLNKRHPVREGTARRVLAAAEALGYHATGLLRHRLAEASPQRTLGFLLQKRDDYFYQALGAELTAATRASRAIEGRAVLEFVDQLVPSLIAAKLQIKSDTGKAAGHVVIERIEILSDLAAQLLVQAGLQDAKNRDGTANSEPTDFGISFSLGLSGQQQPLQGTIQQHLYRPIRTHLLAGLDLLVSVDGFLAHHQSFFTNPGRLAN